MPVRTGILGRSEWGTLGPVAVRRCRPPPLRGTPAARSRLASARRLVSPVARRDTHSRATETRAFERARAVASDAAARAMYFRHWVYIFFVVLFALCTAASSSHESRVFCHAHPIPHHKCCCLRSL